MVDSRYAPWNVGLYGGISSFSSHPLELVYSVTKIVVLVLSGRGGDGNSVAIVDWG